MSKWMSGVSPEPLKNKVPKDRGAKTKFATFLGVSPAVLTNWLRRGVPSSSLPFVCSKLKMTVEEYLSEAGQLPLVEPEKPNLAESGLDTGESMKELSEYWTMLDPRVRAGILMIAKSAAAPVAAEAKNFLSRASKRTSKAKGEKTHN